MYPSETKPATQKILIFGGVGVLVFLLIIFIVINFLAKPQAQATAKPTPTKVIGSTDLFNDEEKNKTTETKSLKKPEASQFASKQNQALSCLTTEICSEEDPLRKCQPNVSTADGTRRILLRDVRQRKQTLLPSKTDKPFWLVECIIEGAAQENASYICSTGSSQNDIKALGVDNFSKLKTAYGYRSAIYSQDGRQITQPLLNTAELKDVYEWETTISKKTSSVFMGVYDQETTGVVSVGSNNGQQQATLSFEDACTLVQDPFGHIFDSHSLEPIANASVEITQKEKNGNFKKMSTQQSGKDGGYSFYVSDGIYRVIASKENYAFPGTSANLNANAGSIYSNLYHGENIVQNGKPELRDIPLDPIDKKSSEAFAKTNPIEILNYFQTIDKKNKKYVIEGQVSHPRALVIAYSNILDTSKGSTRGKALLRTEADNSGYFKLIIPVARLFKNEVVGEIEAIKKTNQSKLTIKINPLMDSVEGVAYDTKGSIIPGAIVELMTAVSTKPFYIAHADSKGYFKIPSENVPPVQTHLRFTTLNNTVENISARTFLASNSQVSANSAFAMAGNTNGDVLGISTETNEPIKPALSTRQVFLAALLLAILVGSVYKVYIRK